ncbi:MAG: biotin/lipoyl-containing protein, partial [Gammaproteobacteria bacterium]
MLIEVKVPALAESVPDAALLDWFKQVGERVERGDNLIDLETDKVTLEIAAPESGVITELRKQTGDIVLEDEVLAVIDTEGTASASAGAPAAVPPTAQAAAPATEPVEKLGPAVRKLIEEHGLDASHIEGTGKGGRLLKA